MSIHTKMLSQVTNGILMSITQSSKYPLPWTQGKTSRPVDYFEQISTVISYKDISERNVEIFIPAVDDANNNRKRVVSVKINGDLISFDPEIAAVLDMNETFEIPEIDRLINLSTLGSQPPVEDEVLRTCIPFFHMQGAGYIVSKAKESKLAPPDGGIMKTNGNIHQLVSPFIQAMKHLDKTEQRRELYIPIVMPGKPHHWVVCALGIDKQDRPHLTYIDSSIKASKECVGFFQASILPEINRALMDNHYEAIESDDIIFNISKQFSQKGCGISASLTIQKLLDGQIKMQDGVRLKDLAWGSEPATSLGMNEDAVRRVQLAFTLAYQKQFISKQVERYKEELCDLKPDNLRVDASAPASHYYKEQIMREIGTHPHTLKQKAEEAFPEDEGVSKRSI